MVQGGGDDTQQKNAKHKVAKDKNRRLAKPKKPESISDRTNKKKHKNALEHIKKSSNQITNSNSDNAVCSECVSILFYPFYGNFNL